MPKFYLKDWHGKEHEFTDDKIFVRGEDGELIQFTQGDPTKKVVLKEQEISGFVLDADFGYCYTDTAPTYTITEGEKYFVTWDGETYEVTALDASSAIPGALFMGDGTLLGLPASDAPFAIGYMNGVMLYTAFTDPAESHTVGIYQAVGGSSADVRYVTFMSDDGTVVYGRKAVAVGDDCANPITRGVFNTPVKESDEKFDYRFVNWADEMGGAVNTAWNKAITEDKIVYAVFETCGGTCGESVTWYISADHKTFTLSGSGAMNNYSNTGTYVQPWRQYISSITSATISSEITHIGNSTFRDFTLLTSITIPTSVTSIGNRAFNNCTSLTSVVIPETVTSVGEWLFADCSTLKSLTVNSALTEIPKGFCSKCSSLTSFTISTSATSIGNGAFSGCASLTTITIPASVTFIDDSAFYGCTKLTSATFNTTTGWKAGSTSLSSSSLSNKSTAATYLKTTYVYYEWTRS